MSTRIVTKTILIDGMTCVSCENKIDRKLTGTQGIESVKVSFSDGIAVVTYDSEIITLTQMEEIIENLDYRVKQPDELVKKKMDFGNLAGIAIIIYAVYLLADHFGVTQILNAFPTAKEGMGYSMLFVIGVLTSVHCVAMCGGICLSQCIPKKEGESPNKLSALRPSILYNLGRVISYTVIGGIVGLLGSVISFSGSLKGIVQIIAGVFMVIMGLNLLNIFPWLRKLNPRMPKIFARKIYAQKKSNSPLYVGLLNGLMPCGPLQAMQIYALSTGSALTGALSMFLFSIGTVPLMLAFGALSSLLSRKFTNRIMSAGAILVVIMGVFMFNNGISLSGINIPLVVTNAKEGSVAVIENGVQIVTTELSSGRYEPITVQKGIPVKWIIKAEKEDINGCNNSIRIPKYKMTYDFLPGDNVIEFVPEESGTFPYSCWMGMIRSKINVVDEIEKAEKSTVDTNTNGETTEDSIGMDDIDELEFGEQSGEDQIAGYSIPTDEIAIAEIKDDVQQVSITMEETYFSPAVIVIQSGLETELTINAKSINSVNGTLLFPYYGAFLTVEEGDNKAYLIPDRDFDFSSSDYSFFAYVKVVDKLTDIDVEKIKEEVKSYIPMIRQMGYGEGTGPTCH